MVENFKYDNYQPPVISGMDDTPSAPEHPPVLSGFDADYTFDQYDDGLKLFKDY